jgi:hypothetical protein
MPECDCSSETAFQQDRSVPKAAARRGAQTAPAPAKFAMRAASAWWTRQWEGFGVAQFRDRSVFDFAQNHLLAALKKS